MQFWRGLFQEEKRHQESCMNPGFPTQSSAHLCTRFQPSQHQMEAPTDTEVLWQWENAIEKLKVVLGDSVDWECLWLKGQYTGTRFDTFLFPAEWLETRSEKLKRQSSYSSRGQQRYTLWWTWYVLLIIACAGVSPVLANLVHCNAIRTFYCVCHHTRVVYKQCYVHCLKGDG